MKENELINIIQKYTGAGFIGDDCAYLKDLNIVITQDSLVENIHFKREWCTPEQLGYKSVAVNISDVLASGAEPKYITIALSLPKSVNEDFVEGFYKGAKKALKSAVIVGGDITGSKQDIMVSISAIGSTKGRNISSRKNAKYGYAVVTKGYHGSGAAGLHELMVNGNNRDLILSHLEPKLEHEFSKALSTQITEEYAMMDTSDGLADALFKIAQSSGVKIKVDYSKIPHLDCVNADQVLFGGEDYKLIAAVPAKYVNLIDNIIPIGYVEKYDGIRLDISGDCYNDYDELNLYTHFK